MTVSDFSRLAEYPEAERRQLLEEIQHHSASTNRYGNPEVDFFLADAKAFSKRDFVSQDFITMEAAQLEAVYAGLRDKLYQAVPQGLRQDDVSSTEWRNRMFAHLIVKREETVSEEIFMGLSP